MGSGVSATLCLDCHKETNAQVVAGLGFHSQLGESCQRCHADHRGRSFEMVRFEKDNFNHRTTGFTLGGAHAPLECEDCHTNKDSWTGLDRDCASCHAEEEPHGSESSSRQLLTRCRSCHSDVDWTALPLPPSVFNHSSKVHADYPLDGPHETVGCEDCHEKWSFVPIESEACTDCHEDPHRMKFVRSCESCHEVVPDWKVPDFDHDATGYHLGGAHRTVDCESCHTGPIGRKIAHETCSDCHEDVHQKQFGDVSCDDCHSLSGPDFRLPSFDHSTTDYPLEGAHREASCTGCHGQGGRGTFVDLPSEPCASCHDDVHAGQFDPRDCSECHSVEKADFEVVGFDHQVTDYPLEGKHNEVPCADCHGEDPAGPWAGLPSNDCDSCHEDWHKGRLEPTDCAACHQETSWEVREVDHSLTDYPLTGAHSEVECAECHGTEEAVYAGLEHESCLDCHREQNPHGSSFEAQDCAGCHETQSWASNLFDHKSTNFDLAPAHSELTCAGCHGKTTPEVAFDFDGLSEVCGSCHQQDAPPAHYRDDDCGACHTGADWGQAGLGPLPHSITGYPLSGEHVDLPCSGCHSESKSWGAVGRECVDCHAEEDPHRGLLGSDCEECHGEQGWSVVRWWHSTTGWPLRGAHRLAECQDCHATHFAGTPDTCESCHRAEATPGIPAHLSNAFEPCDACHNSFNWSSARYPH